VPLLASSLFLSFDLLADDRFVTHVQDIKYGVISEEDLLHDLSTWQTLYLSGRLQKPVCDPFLFFSIQTSKQSH